MKIQQYVKLTIAAAFMSAVSAQAQANTCGEISPLMATLGDSYVELTYTPEAAASAGALDEHSLIAMFDDNNIRSGKGERHHCLGSSHNRKSNPTSFTLEDIVRVETARGTVQLTAWEDSRRKLAAAVIDLPEAAKWRVSSTNGFTTTQLLRRRGYPINESNNQDSRNESLLDAYLYGSNGLGSLQNRNVRPLTESDHIEQPQIAGSHLIEISTHIKRGPSRLLLTQIIYINGRKAEWVTWELNG